jgi:phosphatidate cytidylyltransferase
LPSEGQPSAEAAKPVSNLLVRVATALIALPLILLLIFKAPPWGLYLLVVPTVLLGAFELFAMTHPGDRFSQALGVLLAAGVSASLYFFTTDSRVLVTIFAVVALAGPLLTLVRLGDIKTAALRVLSLSAGPLLVGVPLTMLALLRRDGGAEGSALVLAALAFSWAADTGGYFGGRFFGKHKLYEAVSPKKTVEGAIGGLLGSALSALIVGPLLLKSIPLVQLLVLSVVSGALGQAGDLGESLIKRSVGVKDSGAIVPGHGGILDRVDALLYTSLAVYLFQVWR